MKKARHAALDPMFYMAEARRKLDDARIPISSRKSFLSALQKFVTSDQSRFSVTLSQEDLTAWISTLTLVSKYLFGLYPSPEEERRRSSPQSKEEVPVGRFYRISSSSSEDEAPRRRRAGRQASSDQRQTPSFINIFEEKGDVEEPAEAAGFSVDPRTGLMTVPMDEKPGERASVSSEEESEEERPKRKTKKRRVVESDSESESEEERPRRKKTKKDRKKDRRRKKRAVESSDSESEYEEEKPKRKSKKGKKDKKKRARKERSSSSESYSYSYSEPEEEERKPKRAKKEEKQTRSEIVAPAKKPQPQPEQPKKVQVKRGTRSVQKRPKMGVVKQQVSPRLFPPGRSHVERRVEKKPERPSSPVSPEDKPVGRFFVIDHEDKVVPAPKRKLTPPMQRKPPSPSASSPSSTASPPRVTPPPINMTPPQYDEEDAFKPRDTPRPTAKRVLPQAPTEEADEGEMSDDFVVDELIDAP